MKTNAAAHMWNSVKTDSKFLAKWDLVKTALLWSSGDCQATRDWLCTDETEVRVECQTTKTSVGEVGTLRAEMPEKEANLHWGLSVAALFEAQSQTHIFIVELTPGPELMSEDLVRAIKQSAKQKAGVRIIFWGPDDVIRAVDDGPVSAWLEKEDDFAGYQSKALMVYMTNDIPKTEPQKVLNRITRAALLVTPA